MDYDEEHNSSSYWMECTCGNDYDEDDDSLYYINLGKSIEVEENELS